MAEFCPASLAYQGVGQNAKAAAAQTYGLELTALGPRTVTSATLAFDTSAGWYTAAAPAFTLIAKVRHYHSDVVDFQRTDYASQIFYIRFPKTLSVTRAWVAQAAAQNDSGFAWQAQGTVACDPPSAPSPQQVRQKAKNAKDEFAGLDPIMDPKDHDALSAPPPANALVLVPSQTKPLETSDCAVPFRAAEVKNQAQARYPNVWVSRSARTIVQVAINPDGSLYDAWVWSPSGVSQFDAESLRAARNTTYTGARAYCRPVPGKYFFKVTFDPSR